MIFIIAEFIIWGCAMWALIPEHPFIALGIVVVILFEGWHAYKAREELKKVEALTKAVMTKIADPEQCPKGVSMEEGVGIVIGKVYHDEKIKQEKEGSD